MNSRDSTVLVETGPELDAAGLVHRVQMPAGAGPYPTVVMLHGRLGDEDVMWVFARMVPKPYLVVAPRALLADPAGGYSWLVQPYGTWPAIDAFEPAIGSLSTFLAALPSLYNADPDRQYLMGFSQGAAVSYSAALRRPGLVRGIAGLVGFVPEVDEATVTGALADVPVYAAAGIDDPIVPLEQSRQSADILRAAGAKLEYHEYPTEHKMTAIALRDLQQWWTRLR